MVQSKVVVLGGGGYAGEIIDAIRISAKFHIKGIFDDDIRMKGRDVHGVTYMGKISDFIASALDVMYFVAIGENSDRERIVGEIENTGRKSIVVIHPNASVSPAAKIGEGTYVGAGAFVGPRTDIGCHTIINVGASVGHDAKVENLAQLCPGVRVSSYCTVGRGALLGSNSVLGPSRSIGAYAKLTACSFSLKDIPAGSLAIGVPAKIVNM